MLQVLREMPAIESSNVKLNTPVTYDAREVANFVLDQCSASGREISNLSLQKIVYFCHSWSLAILGRPLFREQFEAWPLGPVMPYLYREFRDFGDRPITARAMKLNKSNGLKSVAEYAFSADVMDLLKQTTETYSKLTPFQLVELTHAANGPWEQVWHHNKKINAGMRIADELILSFYSAQFRPKFAQ